MFLLEAKKKAEKEFKAEQKKLEKQKKEEARRQKYAKKLEVKEQAKTARRASKEVAKTSKSKGAPRSASGADDAARALKEQERLQKEREEREIQEAIRRSKEEARQAELKKTRQALASEPDYDDRVVEQVPAAGRDRVFQQVDNPNNNSEWTDVSINCHYVGTFEVGEAAKVNKEEVKVGINAMREYIHGQRAAVLIICLEGIKVIDSSSNKVAMAHALNRISMAAADRELPLFGVVAKNPGVNTKYCHVFHMRSRKHAESCQGVVMKAFRLAYTNRRLTQTGQHGKPAAATNAVAKKNQAAPRASAPPKGGGAGPRGAPQGAAAGPPRQERVANRQWAKHNPLGGGQRGGPAPRAQPQQPRAPPAAAAGKRAAPKATPAPATTPTPAPSAPPPAVGADYAEAPGPVEQLSGGLESHAWFQAGIPREIAMELLEKEDEGSFVVRESSSQPGNFALTMKGGGLMHHFIVRKVPDGYVLGSEDQGQMPFSDLGTLIIAYAKNKGCLPCCLNLDSFNSVFDEHDEDDGDHEDGHFIDPDYQDMVSLMASVKN
eukprot:m.437035 g.437035  ORF g.437035 m.437035 type:complete len:549 (+) comp18051_c0_seq1:37-1683(+)